MQNTLKNLKQIQLSQLYNLHLWENYDLDDWESLETFHYTVVRDISLLKASYIFYMRISESLFLYSNCILKTCMC